ncbi:cytochrome-c peroxidase [Colwellia sp. 20A7]|uniref:cytochrome-c peroxidase n=1 Tax=Colwellia sp. 20A7 TaxID=2689569 RepID=UPI001F2C3D99|nr:cytochrome c peroxidase [Colwellia sp. 20A7]
MSNLSLNNSQYINSSLSKSPKKGVKKVLKNSSIMLALSLFLAGCNDNNSSTDDNVPTEPVISLDTELREIITAQKLTGDPSTDRELPSIDDPQAQLGMKLFYTKSLGGDLDSACVSCHHPMLGGGDDLALPVGVDAEQPDLLGPGRVHSVTGEYYYSGAATVPRNSPTTFNIALWDSYMFHDGRVESLGKTPKMNGNDGLGIRTPDTAFGISDSNAANNLVAAQARFPVTSDEEMKNYTNFEGTTNAEVRDNLAQRLGNYGNPLGGMLAMNEWLAEFKTGFDDPDGTAEELITFNNIAQAIGEYERSQIFVQTPWKEYVQGDDNAISDTAKRGAKLFFNTAENGGANCSSCHSGDFFTDEDFHVIGMIQLGRGKGDGEDGTEDFGRYRESLNEDEKYAFRTPSLLNVTATGPWGHAGASKTLSHAIRTHLNPQQALDEYDFSQLDPAIHATDSVMYTQRAIDKLVLNRAAGIPSIEDITLTDTEVAELVAFVETLTDPCVEDRECMSQWILDDNEADPDGLRLIAIDGEGNAL